MLDKTPTEEESDLNLGWICAVINSIQCILFCFVYYKLCHITFAKSKSKNWLTFLIYAMIIVDMVVGSATVTSIIVQPDIYLT